MRPLYVSVLAAVLVAVGIGLLGRALGLDHGGPLSLLALVAGMLLVSLVDRRRFYYGSDDTGPRGGRC